MNMSIQLLTTSFEFSQAQLKDLTEDNLKLKGTVKTLTETVVALLGAGQLAARTLLLSKEFFFFLLLLLSSESSKEVILPIDEKFRYFAHRSGSTQNVVIRCQNLKIPDGGAREPI